VSTTDELDVLLYAWLSEPEARRAELRFNDYFQAAFPAICRYVRALRSDPATAQDIAQHALIKLFNHLGTTRRAADERMREAISALRPLDFGAAHVRGIDAWRRQVRSFRDAAIGFRVTGEPQGTRLAWQESRNEINGRIPPLVRQGTHFISDVRTRVEPRLADLVSPESLIGSLPSSVAEPQSSDEHAVECDREGAIDQGVERFLVRLLRYAQGRDWAASDTALGCAGVVGFLTHTSAVRACLPALAIPSNGLLYTIAKRHFLDRLRARKSQTARTVHQLADGEPEGVLETLEMLDPQEANNCEEATHEAESRTHTARTESEVPQSEVEGRYREFLEFLRAPLTRAEGALAAAAAKGKAKAEQARVDSLRIKYERLMAVLAALREHPQPTEEDIARRHGLTRNQVKYVIERIREEFNYFFPELARDAQGRRKHQRAES
jgi:DNA-directed RNA polymerase specialized sigma24 family protein